MFRHNSLSNMVNRRGSVKYFFLVVFVMRMARIMDADILHSGESVITNELSLADSSNLTLYVNITVLEDAVAKGAVCLDGSPPGYHLDRGFGSGANSWLVFMQGGGWCNDTTSCLNRSHSALGSSLYMGESIAFTGILSDVQTQNPDFYGWNRVMVRYCDGSSFTGDVEVLEPGIELYSRGQRIWEAVMEDLLAKGMDKAEQVLLTGCSAGGLATYIHCNEFGDLLPKSVNVKCMADAGFFMDLDNVAGRNLFRLFYNEIVTFHGSLKNLPAACTSKMDPGSLCFFPQYLLQLIKPPLFVVNSAYDTTQVANIWVPHSADPDGIWDESICFLQVANIWVPHSADPDGIWDECKANITTCAPWQVKIMKGYADMTINALKRVFDSCDRGLFVDSCYSHCRTNVQALWHSANSPKLNSKTIAEAVGDWYFDRSVVKYIASDGPHPYRFTSLVIGISIAVLSSILLHRVPTLVVLLRGKWKKLFT